MCLGQDYLLPAGPGEPRVFPLAPGPSALPPALLLCPLTWGLLGQGSATSLGGCQLLAQQSSLGWSVGPCFLPLLFAHVPQ